MTQIDQSLLTSAPTNLVALSARQRITDWFIGPKPASPTPARANWPTISAPPIKRSGVIPSQKKLVLERFFDESGGMQLVIHAPFGARLNRAWGLALRKRFCRSFNFELQAAATDDAIVLSLGTQHSFPLDEVFRYFNSKTVRDLLVQALLDAPMFPIRWRWNAARSLALPRMRNGRRVPAPLQRMEAENLLAAVFPDQLACLRKHRRRPRGSRPSARAPDDRRLSDRSDGHRGIGTIVASGSRRAKLSASRAICPSLRRWRTRFSTRGRTRFSTTRPWRNGGRRPFTRAVRVSRSGRMVWAFSTLPPSSASARKPGRAR